MKRLLSGISILLILFTMSGCATILGGEKYWAHVRLERDSASIFHNGELKGQGEAIFKVKRREANDFLLQIKEKGCETQEFHFTGRHFKTYALVGSTILSIPTIGAYFLIGAPLIIDGVLGSWYEPDVNEPNVYRIDMDNFEYRPQLSECIPKTEVDSILENPNQIEILKTEEQPEIKSKDERLYELKQLYIQELITEEEYDKKRNEILDED